MESLLAQFKKYLPDYRVSCLNNLLLLILCLLDGGTVNLYKLRGKVSKFTGKPIQANSGYKRLLRIFDAHAYSRLWLCLLQCGFQLLRWQSNYLILDGTSWKRHGISHQYLTLSIEYRSVAIPIYWVDLAKLGISNCQERKRMFRRVFNHFNLQGKTLLADREYIGSDWINYLTDNGLAFTIRLRKRFYQKQINKAPGLSYQELIHKVMRSKLAYKVAGKTVQVEGHTYQFVVAKYLDATGKPTLLLLLSSQESSPVKIAASYLKRWKIECCFRHLKSNGFDLEQINLRGKARTKLLMAIVVFAYIISIHEGLKTYKKVRCIQRKDGTIEKAESIFRHGYDNLGTKVNTFTNWKLYLVLQIRQAKKAYRSHLALIV